MASTRPTPLLPGQIAQFRRDGCIKLRNVLSLATLAHFGHAIMRLTVELNTEQRPLEENRWGCWAPTRARA